MKRMLRDTLKVFVIFTACTFLFYFGLRIMHAEYKEYHRYDPPEGPAVKVFDKQEDFMNRFNLFFRLGE